MIKRIPCLLALTCLMLVSCKNDDKRTSRPIQKKLNQDSVQLALRAKEHILMVEELKTIFTTAKPQQYPHLNLMNAADLEAQLPNVPPARKTEMWFKFNLQLLNGGNTARCISEIESYFAKDNRPYASILSAENMIIFELLALAYLRMGEVENCQANHVPESCIIPMKQPAFHTLKAGSEKAIELYAMMYKKFPNPKYKWLLNIAYMTLGKHPKQVPSNELIKYPNFKLEQKNFPAFEEIAMSVGLAQNGLSGGTSIDDFNNDGYLDIFMTAYGLDENAQLFLNDQKGGYSNSTKEAGLEGILSGLNCTHADYDNDGNIDILVLRGGWFGNAGTHPNSLLKNMGNGQFKDVTRSSGIYSKHPTQTAAWADVNKDGFLDLFIGNESMAGENHPSEFYLNNGDGTFREASREFGLGGIKGFVKGVAFGDIDNDKWPDLYISVLGGENILMKNNNGKFINISESAKVSEPIFSFPCWFFDANNDGFQDIFVSAYDARIQRDLAGEFAKELEGLPVNSEKPRLFINNGDNTFTESSKAYGVDKTMFGMGSNFGDLDNDGFLDFYIGTGAPDFSTIVPNRMFRNINGKAFEEVTSAGNFGHIQKGHGVAFADLDMDGDQDIYAVMGGASEGDDFTNILYENPIAKNNWIVIELEGTKTNKKAIGSIIEIEFNSGEKIFNTVGTGGSFGASSIQQEIGLGKNKTIKTLTIHWQNGENSVLTEVAGLQKIKIIEGSNNLITIPYVATPFQKSKHHQHHH